MNNKIKSKKKIIGGFVLLIVAFIFIVLGYYKSRPHKMTEKEMEAMFVDNNMAKDESNIGDSNESEKENEGLKNSSNNKQNKIIVEIKGEVVRPDVYSLKEGSRIYDLLEKAGGTTDEAVLEGINRAAALVDGQCIVIENINDKGKEKKAISQGAAKNDLAGNEQKKVNINVASLEELMTVSGIGKTKATAIIAYREKSGAFKKVEDLKNVDGIGEKTVEKLKDKICVS